MAGRIFRIAGFIGLMFFAFLLVAYAALSFFTRGPWDERISESERQWGITFSVKYARQLTIPVEESFTALLDDLGVKLVRLPVYWPDVEQKEGAFDFALYDRLLDIAEARDVDIVLTIGRRVPRWPECHVPKWAEGLSEDGQQEKTMNLVAREVEYFTGRKNIIAWQVENEPFVMFFGECRRLNEDYIAREVDRVRALDPSRPIVMSDSGELSFWFKAARYADIFGTTMYRIVPTPDQKRYTSWRIPAWFYTKKANLAHRVTPLKDVAVIELQAEPWALGGEIQTLSFEEQSRSFSSQQFSDNIAYVRKTNFRTVYLWGAEWWYWAKMNGHPEFWEFAKELFAGKI